MESGLTARRAASRSRCLWSTLLKKTPFSFWQSNHRPEVDAPFLVSNAAFRPAESDRCRVAAFQESVAGYYLYQIERSAHRVPVDEREHVRLFEVGVNSIELGHGVVNPCRDPIEDGIAEPVGDNIFNLLDLKEEREVIALVHSSVGRLSCPLLLLGEGLAPEIPSLQRFDNLLFGFVGLHRLRY